ncbi:LOW QUALITY PROTEIN: sperm flagellar protein 2-like [Pseudoliparis swirei]|uniref:LOW QUALITY PROTEIN: sperm flagellar protein 2-like n=1 Tax=Pseudoliparis swirei TaxID=2059687 RepID=UPI0024BDEDFA|nr:LOW QUALITY PROTEIN: sperm flagellar protein 2-like [Pseudoliparis swirei]
MSDILCRWLNEELRLSKAVDPKTFASDFSSGYLIGEVLHKYQLQNDFSMFMKKDTSSSRLNNFTRVEPTLRLLEISFDTNAAQEVMEEKQGAATRLLYQLYVSLEKKKKAEISGTLMELMQPAANVGLHKKEHDFNSDRLHQVVKRDAELKLQNISQRYEEKCQQLSDRLVMTLPIQQKRQLGVQDEKRLKNIEKLRVCRQKHNDIRTFNQSTIVQVPKPPPYTAQLHLKRRQQQQQRREQQVQTVQTEIAKFETRRKLLPCGLASLSSGQPPSGDFSQGFEVPGSGAKLTLQSNSKYIQDIRQRLEEKAVLASRRRKDKTDSSWSSSRPKKLKSLIPEKPMREWKELLFSGLPLYESVKGQQPSGSAPLDPVELQKQETLKNQHYEEYTNMVGEWAWPEEATETKWPLTNNDILGHVVQRLRNIVHQPVVKPPPPSFPRFTIKACVLGKFCSGKTTCLAKLAAAHGIYVLSADSLIKEALNAYRNGEEDFSENSPQSPRPASEVTEQQGEKDSELPLSSSTSPKPDLDTQEESRDGNVRRSTRAMQGEAAEKVLMEGNAIPNELLVDIMLEAIRQVPAQSGWILDGFPVDMAQAYLLEKGLGGSVDEADGVVSGRTELAADPHPPKPAPTPPPALDLVLLLDVPDECVIRRPFSRPETDTAAAAAAAASASSHPTDTSLYLAQIPHRITAFQDTWPKLEEWFGKRQNILVRVDADVDEEQLGHRVASVLQRVMMQTQQALAAPPGDDVVLDGGKAPDSSCPPPPVDQAQGLAKKAHAESHIGLDEEKAQSVKSKSNTPSSPRGPSRKVSTSSVTTEDSPGVPPKPASPCPGSSSWVYVDEPLPPELSEYLCSHWDTVCDSYVNNLKTTMHRLSSQPSAVHLHLFNIREEYKHYMGRPDLKQELVSHWQKDFNSIPDDMREDEETKAELHLRLDELRERLWDISDKRKEEDEKERAKLMGDGWLEEHTAVLINHHSVLMQVELDRFKDTFRILKVYYLGMYREVLPELPSRLDCIPLLDQIDAKNQEERQGTRTEPAGRSVSRQTDYGEDKKRTRPHRDSRAKSRIQAESVKLPHEKLISDYEDALTAIRQLVSAEVHQGETKEQKEKEKAKTDIQEVRDKIHKEYAAALDHEGNAAKARLERVKGHGLVMVQSLQSRAAQTSSSMEKLLETHNVAEMKSIEQLSEVVGHHIEAGAKLQNELVMECVDFYLNGDCHMVASPAPPPRPPALEKPTRSTPTVTQLESLQRQLCNVAPSGLMSSSHFLGLLMDIISVNMGRNTLPEPWNNKNETQLMEMLSLLIDVYDLIDWRQFLLSAALPWPFPSLSQLLLVLQRFKAVDTGHSGYVDEDQYLQTELWFSNESVQPVPGDPSEPLPYDRLANIRKFFFQLFADRSLSPPRLDYVCMLQYFAAAPDPRQGFIRALSVVLGQHLKHSSPPGPLVKSMPRIEEAAELSSSTLDGADQDGDALCSGEWEVSVPALLAVTCHKVAQLRDGSPLPPGCLSREERTEQLVRVFGELGYEPGACAPFSVLSRHPFIQRLMETSTQYQLVNIHGVLLAHQDEIPEG